MARLSKKLPGAVTAGPWDGHMVFGGVMVLDLRGQKFATPEEFLENFKDREGDREVEPGEGAAQPQRYIEFEAALDESLEALCVRYHHLTEVAAVEAFSGLMALNSTHGRYCLHPHWPQYVIELSFSQLYSKGQAPLSLEGESEPFLNSLMFTADRPVPVTAFARRRWLASPDVEETR